ncbi:peptidoglycan editing factor PgeF [Paenibacillus sp. GYB003]|uniref:peptidoglycan editing factor PgeF n=1 Tax=Paenibacillus sp. GYB003 TaxID=2994392 RepID=UPI002F9668E0
MEPFRLTTTPGQPARLHIERWERDYPGLSAGFTTRLGGVSAGHYDSLNCALHVADSPEHVAENRKRLADALRVPLEAWTCGEQVHGRNVAVVRRSDRGRGLLAREDAIPDTDALITNEPGIWLTSFYADCVPLYVFDPVRGAVGLAHAGWKGTVLEIARHTVEAMSAAFGTKPVDVLAAIGPSIGPCCYEVDGRVIERIEDCLTGIGADAEARARVYTPAEGGKAMLGLQELNRQIMIKAGILPMHIEMCGMCTGCRTDLFYSHRKENGSTGRMASWIGLRLNGS